MSTRRTAVAPRRAPARRAATTGGNGVVTVMLRRRLVALQLVLLLVMSVTAVRVGQVQVLSADRLAALGENQRVREIEIGAERGSMFDREGRELALSMPQRTVWADPRLVENPGRAAKALAPIVGVDEALLHERLSRRAAFVYVARKVDDKVAEQVKRLALPGVFFLDEPKRFLPAGDLAASVIGQVGLDNNGLSGLERQFEKQLVGQPGLMIGERDAAGGEIPGSVRAFRPAVRGDDLVLTLDRSLQYETERALGSMIASSNAKGGIAIVIETATGEILSLSNMSRRPEGIRTSRGNIAVTDVYEPGSVNKLITIAAALEERIVSPADTMLVPDKIPVADHVFSDHDPHPPIRWSITDVMSNSSNVGSIMIGQRLGKARLDHYLRQFGFGEKTALDFPGESKGLLIPTKQWYGTTLATVSIGYGMAVTAMQMAAAYNTIANNGVYVAPKLVRATVDAEGQQHLTAPSPKRRVISGKTSAQITAMLSEVVRVGTGKLASIDGYSVAGKTGTARKTLIGARGYKAGAYIATFAGFVPAERPAMTAIVILDEPTPIYGGLVAAPVFAEIMRYGLRQFRIPPPAAAKRPEVKVSDSAVADVGTPGAARVVPPATTAPSSAAPRSAPPSSASTSTTTTTAPAKPRQAAPSPSTTSTTVAPGSTAATTSTTAPAG